MAGLDNAGLLREENNGVDEILNLYEVFRAPTISFKISRGQRKTSDIPVQIIRDLARLWQRRTVSSVQNHKKNKPRSERASVIRLTGSTPEESRVYVDLLKDRMREKVRIEEKYRGLDYSTRKTILRTAWNRRQNTLFRMFG